MSKEYLEAFGRITLHTEYDNDGSYDCLQFEDDCKLVDEALERLESIDNFEPSEALKCLERIDNTLCLNNNKGKLEFGVDTEEHTDCDSAISMVEDLETIKQSLIKAQKPKQYLTWETLPFKKKSPECPRGIVKLNAKMGDTPLKVFCSYSKDGIHHYVEIYRVINDTLYIFMNLLDDESDEEYKLEPQLFNDLHLEEVGE